MLWLEEYPRTHFIGHDRNKLFCVTSGREWSHATPPCLCEILMWAEWLATNCTNAASASSTLILWSSANRDKCTDEWLCTETRAAPYPASTYICDTFCKLACSRCFKRTMHCFARPYHITGDKQNNHVQAVEWFRAADRGRPDTSNVARTQFPSCVSSCSASVKHLIAAWADSFSTAWLHMLRAQSKLMQTEPHRIEYILEHVPSGLDVDNLGTFSVSE